MVAVKAAAALDINTTEFLGAEEMAVLEQLELSAVLELYLFRGHKFNYAS